MHTFYESVGLSRIRSARSSERLIRETIMNFDKRNIFRNEQNIVHAEFSRYYAPDLGVTVCGEFDESGSFHPEYAFPFYRSKTVSMKQVVEYEKHGANDSLGAICDDPRIGTSIIFYLSNLGEYMAGKEKGIQESLAYPICFSALAKSGTIVLPIYKTAMEEEAELKAREEYLKLVAGAREGDEEAIEALTADDMNNYNILSKRVQKEDILSIVDTYFQPYGIECDIYNICGNVISCEKVQNTYTNENVWKMQIEACDVFFDLCINENRLEGVPMEGARFRGVIWLQGVVQFENAEMI